MSTCDPLSKGGCLWVNEQVNQSDLTCSESFAQIIFKALKRENYTVYYKKEKMREMCAQIWFVLIYYPENHLTALSIHHMTPCGGALNQVNHKPKSTGSQCLLYGLQKNHKGVKGKEKKWMMSQWSDSHYSKGANSHYRGVIVQRGVRNVMKKWVFSLMEDPAPQIIPVCNELLHKTHFKREKSHFNYTVLWIRVLIWYTDFNKV